MTTDKRSSVRSVALSVYRYYRTIRVRYIRGRLYISVDTNIRQSIVDGRMQWLYLSISGLSDHSGKKKRLKIFKIIIRFIKR